MHMNSQEKKLNFWNLMWDRYTSYNSFYEMFLKKNLKPDQKKMMLGAIIKPYIQTSILFTIGGIAISIWWWIDPTNEMIYSLLKIAMPIALVLLSCIFYISRKMLKEYKKYSKDVLKSPNIDDNILFDIFGT